MDAFQRRHPLINILFFIFATVFAIKMNHPVFLAVSLLASLSYGFRLGGKMVLKVFFGGMVPLAVFIVLINFFISHYGVTVIGTLPDGNNLTIEALINGFVTAFETSSMLLWFYSLSLVMTEEKLLHLTGRFLPRITLLIMMTLRFIPMYTRQYRETVCARKSMFIQDDSLKSKLKNAFRSLDGVVTRSLEHSIDTADSMKSRGYGSGKIKSYSRISFSSLDFIFGCIMLSLIISSYICVSSFDITAYYNPFISFTPFSLKLALTAIIYALFCFLPLIYDGLEVLRWHSLYSKI